MKLFFDHADQRIAEQLPVGVLHCMPLCVCYLRATLTNVQSHDKLQ
jgi:hypothetical protein